MNYQFNRINLKTNNDNGQTPYSLLPSGEFLPDRGIALSLRWLIQYSRARAGKSMASKFANELMDAANQTGSAIRKREETHRMAEANKAFAHYRY